MGLALILIWFGVVGIIQSLFLLFVIYRKRNGDYIHSISTRVIGTLISLTVILPLVWIVSVFSY